jgi:hypothetical protein
MQVINNNELFTQVAAEESSIASGGGPVTATNATVAFLVGNGIGPFTPAQVATVFAIGLVPAAILP